MHNEQKNYLNAFEIGYDAEINTDKLFLIKYGKIAHNINCHIDIDFKNIFEFFKNIFENNSQKIIHSRLQTVKGKKNRNIDNVYIIELDKELIVEIQTYNITFYFSEYSRKDEILKIIEKIPTKQNKKKHTKKFFMLIRSQRTESGFDLKSFKVKKMKISIEENYNNDFIEIHKNIAKFLKDDKRNGIVMLHGKYGTGKSTYIRFLMRNVNKRFIYLPLHLISGLSSPDLINFFTLYKNSVLILEDCEEIIKPRSATNSSSEALVNLLNLGDGLLSDALSIKLVCTFNADLKKIDSAILRKGRLAIRYEFTPLSVEKSKALVEKNNIDLKIDSPTTIADIFNTNQISEEFDKNKKLGF